MEDVARHYEVVADRDKGDDPQWGDTKVGDRITFDHLGPTGRGQDFVVRIERPVPTEHCLSTAHHTTHEWGNHDGQPGTGFWCPGFDATDERPVPTTDEPARVPEASCFRAEPHGPHYWGQYQGDKYTKHCLGVGSERSQPSVPTREQIAEAEALIKEADGALSVVGDGDWTWQDTMLRRIADHYSAVLALLQKGADR